MSVRIPRRFTFEKVPEAATVAITGARGGVYESRRLNGPAGGKLFLQMTEGNKYEGAFLRVDREPRSGVNRALVMAVPGGLVVAYYEERSSFPTTGYLPMCSRWKTFLGFGRTTARRWYKVVV
jgi:hypothetical protein